MLPRSSAPLRMRRTFGMWTLLLTVTAAALAGILGIHTLGDQAAALGHQPTATTVAQPVTEASPPDFPAFSTVASDRVDGAGLDGAVACELLALLSAVTVVVLLLHARGSLAVFFTPAGAGAAAFRVAAGGIGARPVSLTVLGISRI